MSDGLKKRLIQERVIIAKTLLETILDDLPSVQPEQELLKDGTLVVKTDFDMTKFDRVNVIQNGTYYGDLFYQDDDTRRKGKWIIEKDKFGYYVSECSNCHWLGHGHKALMYNPTGTVPGADPGGCTNIY